MSRIIEASEVTVALGGRRVVANVGLQVEEGRWVGLIGPNGAGKTTMLGVLAGSRVRDAGAVRVGGLDPQHARRRVVARTLAVVAQRPVLPPGMLVFDYVLLGRTAHLSALRHETRRDVRVVGDVLAELGLDHLAGRTVDTLSGGEAQRVALARAIAQDTPILLLDEPTASLDVGRQQEVLELVDTLRRSRGLTVVSALHDLTAAGQYSDELVLLVDGCVVADGSASEVLDEQVIAEHYGVHVQVVVQGDGSRFVVPRRPRRDEPGVAP